MTIIISDKAAQFIYYTIALLLFFFFLVGYFIHYKRLFSKANIERVDAMSSELFEKFISYLYKKQGYTVKHTGKKGDHGADIVVKKDNKISIIQAKHNNETRVGVSAVQQTHTAVDYFKADLGIVITNSEGFTEEAKEMALKLGVRLISRKELAEMIVNIKQKKSYPQFNPA